MHPELRVNFQKEIVIIHFAVPSHLKLEDGPLTSFKIDPFQKVLKDMLTRVQL